MTTMSHVTQLLQYMNYMYLYELSYLLTHLFTIICMTRDLVGIYQREWDGDDPDHVCC